MGKVPVLIDGDLVVSDSLAIVEYLAEKHRDRGIWPLDPAARAYARSICAELHAGFGHLRDRLPMNCELHLANVIFDREAQRDIARVVDIWVDCRTRFGKDGPFLFGAFSAVDAYYAPVVRRFLAFDVTLPAVAQVYVATVDGLPSMKAWMTAALAEHDFVDIDEPYREKRG